MTSQWQQGRVVVAVGAFGKAFERRGEHLHVGVRRARVGGAGVHRVTAEEPALPDQLEHDAIGRVPGAVEHEQRTIAEIELVAVAQRAGGRGRRDHPRLRAEPRRQRTQPAIVGELVEVGGVGGRIVAVGLLGRPHVREAARDEFERGTGREALGPGGMDRGLIAGNAASAARLADRGPIAVGLRADLALWDLATPRVFNPMRDQRTRRHWSPYAGRTLRATPVRVLRGGATVAERGTPVGAPRGAFLAR